MASDASPKVKAMHSMHGYAAASKNASSEGNLLYSPPAYSHSYDQIAARRQQPGSPLPSTATPPFRYEERYAIDSRHQPPLGGGQYSSSFRAPQNLNSGSIDQTRSPSRLMRVSYAEPMNGHSSPNSRSQRSPHSARQSTAAIRGSAATAHYHSGGGANASKSFLAVICPGCRILSAVTFISFVQFVIMTVLSLWHFIDPEKTFARFLDDWSLEGNAVLYKGQVYRLVSAMVVHSSWVQLLVNLFIQQQLGNVLGARYHSALWFRLWIVCGVFGSFFGSVAQMRKSYMGVTAANLGACGFHLSEILLIVPQLRTSDLKMKALMSCVIAAFQLAILTIFPRTSILANLVSFSMGLCIGVLYHRKGSDLPRWYGKARFLAILFLFSIVVAVTVRVGMRLLRPPPF